MRLAMLNTTRGWGGAEEQMLVLACELIKRGDDVCIIARRGGPVAERFQAAGLRVLPVERKGARALFSPFASALRARRCGFELVHSHRDHDLPLGKLLALSCGVPLLLTQHCRPNKPSTAAYRLADRVVAVSAYIADGIAKKLPWLSDRCAVVVNGIDLTLFSGANHDYWRNHPLAAGKGPLIGAVGALYKGQEELVEELPALLAEFPGLALVLIGEDQERRGRIQDVARRLGVAEAVIFAGRIPRDEMKHALAGIDVNVSAFRNEGFGLSVVEGLAVGTPFVGYRAGGYPEIIKTPEAGTLVESSGQLGAAIAERLRQAKGDAGCRKVAEKFSLAHMVDAYQRLYESLKMRC